MSVLEFLFETEGEELYFRYVFASEEYERFADTAYHDIVRLSVDGGNIALIPGTTTPVSINSVNPQANAEYFIDNRPQPGETVPPYSLAYPGFTKVLTAAASNLELAPGRHHFKAVIMNVADAARESVLFIGAGTLSTQQTLPLVITDAVTTESAESIVFFIRLTLPSDQDVTIDFQTEDGTAFAGEDYLATSGTLTIPAGETVGTIDVVILKDLLDEDDETFFVTLSNRTDAILLDAQGQGTIQA